MSSSSLLWGIDLGGTKMEGTVIAPGKKPQILSRIRIPTEKQKGYPHILQQIADLLHQLHIQTGASPHKIGIGIPGTLEPSTQTIKNANTTLLNGKPFHKDLVNKLELPVTMANDANCFALAETKFGIIQQTAPESTLVFGVIMGTGVGGGVIVDGKIIGGLQGIAGEWGHNFLDASGGACYCGKTGCVETVISGPALERFYQMRSGNKKTLQEIHALYLQGNDTHAAATVDRLCHFFGKSIAQVINILDPEYIVLGGGVGNIDALYDKGVTEAKEFVFNHTLETRFLKPALGDSAGVIGAAYLTESC